MQDSRRNWLNVLPMDGKNLLNRFQRYHRIISMLSFVIYFFAIAALENHVAASPDPLEVALERLNLQKDELHFNPAYFATQGGDKFLLRTFSLYETQPLEIPYILSHVRLGALEDTTSLHMTMQGMLTKADSRVRRGVLNTNPLAPFEENIKKSKMPLAESIAAIHGVKNQQLSVEQQQQLMKETENIPRDVQDAAALILWASASGVEWQERAFRRVANLITPEFRERLVISLSREEPMELPEETEWIIENTDFLALYAGAADLALAVDRSRKTLMNRNTTETISLNWQTPMGRIILQANDNLNPAPYTQILLSIDFEGDDVYESAANNAELGQSISTVIDLKGNDVYKSDEKRTGNFGSGVFGYGILVDAAGDDIYEAPNLSLGSGLFGFGALMDMGGSDTYRAISHSQGAGSLGLGLLSDLGGTDTYEAYSMAQGYGFTKGCGMLMDIGNANDTYILKNDKVLFPAAQSPEKHNCSAGQGFGIGLRGDFSDGHSWAGGYGLLIDEGGDDTYTAAIMAQGSGYWYGLGFLLDRVGNDTYSGYWYCQGSGAHFAVGGLMDWQGDDKYSCTAQVAMGGAHDWSVAWLVDAEGNDQYDTGDLSLGAGNMNGIGIFLDVKGNDSYKVNPILNHSGGGARITAWGSLREAQMNAGVFLDCGGKDIYTGMAGADNTVWRCPMEHPDLSLRSELGVGVDAETQGESSVRLEPYTEKPPEEK